MRARTLRTRKEGRVVLDSGVQARPRSELKVASLEVKPGLHHFASVSAQLEAGTPR